MAPAQPQDSDVVTYSKFTGLRNTVDPERFDAGDLVVANNVDIDVTGRLSRRGGRTLVTATATHSLWADREIALCVQGSQLFRIATDYSLSLLKSGLTAGQRMSYTRVDDRVYMSNGVESFVLDQGRVRSWGLPVPPYPTVTIGTGQMPGGAYQFVTTYMRSDGQESGARIAARIDVPANGKLTFQLTIPADVGVVGHNVYLSRPDGDVLYLALYVPVATVSASYAGDTSEFAYPLKTQFLSAPPAGHLIAYFKGHAFVAVEDMIYPSEATAYELFDLRNYIPSDGRITLMGALEDNDGNGSGFFIGTDKSCGVLIGANPAEFKYVPKADYGAILGTQAFIDGALFADGATKVGGLPAWVTTQGICVGMPGMEIRNITRSKYNITAGGNGAAVFMPGPNRFIAISNL
jgi:hypothetical protein